MPATLSPDTVAGALALRDLTDPAQGPHAVQLLLDAAVDALAARWGSAVRLLRSSPVVAVEDNYDRLGYSRAAITRDSRYSRYLSGTVMLRSHTSAGVPPALRELAAERTRPPTSCSCCPGSRTAATRSTACTSASRTRWTCDGSCEAPARPSPTWRR